MFRRIIVEPSSSSLGVLLRQQRPAATIGLVAGLQNIIIPPPTTTTNSARVAGIATATPSLRMPLDEFRDTVSRQKRMAEKVGRSWSVQELRRKSYDDLHKLWYVLYKERNMLLTEQQLSRRKGLVFPQPERMHKVRKSMGAIRHVLGERKREIAAFMLRRMGDENDESEE